MRGAVPLSVALHAGILGAVLLVGVMPPDSAEAESVAIDIVSLEIAVATDPVVAATEVTQTLVSSGAETAAPETVVAERSKPAAPQVTVEVASPTLPVETLQATPVETAQVLVASLTEAPDLETILPVPAPSSSIEIADAQPAERIDTVDPIEVASIAPVAEMPHETPAAPVPRPRPERPPEAKPEKQPEAKPVTEPEKARPAPRPQQQASLGNGGADAADSRSGKAAGGKGSRADGGSAATSKYPAQVQARVSRSVRYPSTARAADGEAQVTFTVAAGGGVSGIKLSRSSGNAALDEAALAAVSRAAPFPPIPVDAGRTSWTFTVPVAFRK